MRSEPAIWFPAVRTGSGTDVFTERLAKRLSEDGIRAEITWLPLRAEYLPWTVSVPKPPDWATVCHVNTWLHPRFIPKTLPVVATLHHSIHDPALLPYKGWLRAAYHRHWIAPIERHVLYRSNKVIAVSQFAADMARKTLADVPMQVIYNGIDTDVFKPGNRSNSLGEVFRLLYVGSWMARKGVDLLVPIMCELGDSLELRYTGGPAAEKDNTQMPKNMIDIGRLHGDMAIAEAMRSADALLFPSRSEGFGLVAAEAVACGLPVIATRGSSLVEVVDDGVTGILCAQDNVLEFAMAAREIAGNLDHWKIKVGEAGHQINRRFDIREMVNSYISTYTLLLNQTTTL